VPCWSCWAAAVRSISMQVLATPAWLVTCMCHGLATDCPWLATSVAGPVSVVLSEASLNQSSLLLGASASSLPGVLRYSLVHLALAAACGEPLLLLGPTCYKSLLVRMYLEISGRGEQCLKMHLTAGGVDCRLQNGSLAQAHCPGSELNDAGGDAQWLAFSGVSASARACHGA
jgi:hypothetical protein